MSDNRSYAALISAILAAGKQRERFPRPRTYTPGPRQLASMTSPVLIAEVQRRIVYQQGRLSDRDCRQPAVRLLIDWQRFRRWRRFEQRATKLLKQTTRRHKKRTQQQ